MVNSDAADPATLFALSFDDLTRILREGREKTDEHLSVAALQRAGHAAGEGILRELASGTPDGDPAALAKDTFWDTVASFFESRGWGRLSQSRIHPGMGLLTAYDWAEARDARGGGMLGCPISTGILARLLGEVAQGPIAVLQVACPSRGDDACQFLFGHEGAVGRSYDLLMEGVPLDRLLEEV